jgi:Protein of unknown function (DUF3572)
MSSLGRSPARPFGFCTDSVTPLTTTLAQRANQLFKVWILIRIKIIFAKREMGTAMKESQAEEVGANGLLFLVTDNARLQRFLAETGLEISDLKEMAQSREILTAALNHLLEDESVLLTFASNYGIPVGDINRAQVVLGGAAPWEST